MVCIVDSRLVGIVRLASIISSNELMSCVTTQQHNIGNSNTVALMLIMLTFRRVILYVMAHLNLVTYMIGLASTLFHYFA